VLFIRRKTALLRGGSFISLFNLADVVNLNGLVLPFTGEAFFLQAYKTTVHRRKNESAA
jgi:hypothetical protein